VEEHPVVVAFQTGVLPCVVARVPNTTRVAGGFVAWLAFGGTTWHSLQAMGAAKAAGAAGFRCAW
jgi:hypothetical protein